VIERIFGKGAVTKLHAYLEQQGQASKPLRRKPKRPTRRKV